MHIKFRWRVSTWLFPRQMHRMREKKIIPSALFTAHTRYPHICFYKSIAVQSTIQWSTFSYSLSAIIYICATILYYIHKIQTLGYDYYILYIYASAVWFTSVGLFFYHLRLHDAVDVIIIIIHNEFWFLDSFGAFGRFSRRCIGQMTQISNFIFVNVLDGRWVGTSFASTIIRLFSLVSFTWLFIRFYFNVWDFMSARCRRVQYKTKCVNMCGRCFVA